VDIQSLSAFNSDIQTPREANGQPPQDQTTLDRTVDPAPDAAGRQSVAGAPATSTEAVASANYARNARMISASTAASGSISLFA
jgi:hypothetical protein